MSLSNPDIKQFVHPKFNLSKDVKKSEILNYLVSEMCTIPDYMKYKLDTEFISYTCNIVENIVKKKHGINKKELVINSFSKLFNITPKEQLIIENIVDFLWNNKRIKKIKKLSIYTGLIMKWLSKKIL